MQNILVFSHRTFSRNKLLIFINFPIKVKYQKNEFYIENEIFRISGRYHTHQGLRCQNMFPLRIFTYTYIYLFINSSLFQVLNILLRLLCYTSRLCSLKSHDLHMMMFYSFKWQLLPSKTKSCPFYDQLFTAVSSQQHLNAIVVQIDITGTCIDFLCYFRLSSPPNSKHFHATSFRWHTMTLCVRTQHPHLLRTKSSTFCALALGVPVHVLYCKSG